MKTFELILKGYNGSTSETDDLVYWINALSIDHINNYVKNSGVVLHEIPRELDYKYDFIDGVDFEVDADGNILHAY